MPEDRSVVIALGNPLMTDDGFGLRVLERLLDGWDVPGEVELVDGGTWGLSLLPAVESSRRLLLIDAIDLGVAPGEIVSLTSDEIPGMLSMKVSPHHVDMLDVLALTRLRGTRPVELLAIGVQPDRVCFGIGLTDEVEPRIDDVARLVVGQLEDWGHSCTEHAFAHA
jgi:hydrogenase maturation protease